jgi:hypothetical protein
MKLPFAFETLEKGSEAGISQKPIASDKQSCVI